MDVASNLNSSPNTNSKRIAMESVITPKDRNTTNAGASGHEFLRLGETAGDCRLGVGPRLLAWSLAPTLAALHSPKGDHRP